MDYATEIKSINQFETKVFNLIHASQNGEINVLKGADVYHLQAVCESFGIDHNDCKRKADLIKLIRTHL